MLVARVGRGAEVLQGKVEQHREGAVPEEQKALRDHSSPCGVQSGSAGLWGLWGPAPELPTTADSELHLGQTLQSCPTLPGASVGHRNLPLGQDCSLLHLTFRREVAGRDFLPSPPKECVFLPIPRGRGLESD